MKLMITKLEQLSKMMELQDKLNIYTNGEDWKSNQDLRWLRASWIEAAELINFVQWKWWKKQTTNIIQGQIELVDIFHFLLSQAIKDQISVDELFDCFEEVSKKDIKDDYGFLDTASWIEELVISLLDEGVYVDYYGLFAIVCDEMQLSFDDLYRMYVGKNVLNIFRQDHGYKEGTYIKEWKSPLESNSLVEDNVYLEIFMAEAVKEQPEDMYSYMYNKLSKEYANNL